MVVYVADSESGRSRLGFRVSRKVGPAVVRNRIRRRVREVFRKERSRFPSNLDIICVIKPRVNALVDAEAGFTALGDSFVSLVVKAARRDDR